MLDDSWTEPVVVYAHHLYAVTMNKRRKKKLLFHSWFILPGQVSLGLETDNWFHHRKVYWWSKWEMRTKNLRTHEHRKHEETTQSKYKVILSILFDWLAWKNFLNWYPVYVLAWNSRVGRNKTSNQEYMCHQVIRSDGLFHLILS